MNSIAANGATVTPATEKPADPLAKRIGSGLALGAVALACVWFGGAAFALLVVVAALVMSWEWDRLTGGTGTGLLAGLHGAVAVAALALAVFGWPAAALAAVAAGAIGAGLVAAQTRRARSWAALGVLYLVVPCIALIWLRWEPAVGREVVVWLLAVVWATDIGAYGFGRAIGGPKLAPRFSPKKTWAGLIGGMASAAAIGWGLAASFAIGDPVALALAASLLAVLGQIGDVSESAIKRHFRVKDSSGLIPGHGGLLDRVDGLLAVAPVAALALLATAGGMVWR